MKYEWCCEQILKEACYTTGAVRPLTSLLTNYPSKVKTCRELLAKQKRTHKQRSPIDSHTLTHHY